MCNQCAQETCNHDAEPLCLECLQVFVLKCVSSALEAAAEELKKYHDAKRRME